MKIVHDGLAKQGKSLSPTRWLGIFECVRSTCPGWASINHGRSIPIAPNPRGRDPRPACREAASAVPLALPHVVFLAD